MLRIWLCSLPAANLAVPLDVDTFVHKYVRMAQTVRINPADYDKLAALADKKKVPLTEALSIAIEACRRKDFLEEYVAAVAKFRAEHPDEAAEDDAEAALFDSTSSDGLEDEPPYPDPFAVKKTSGKRIAKKATSARAASGAK